MTMTDSKSVLEQAQIAVSGLNCSHPDTVITELERVLERIGRDHPDAEIFKRAIDRLEDIAREMANIQSELSEPNYTFGKLKEV